MNTCITPSNYISVEFFPRISRLWNIICFSFDKQYSIFTPRKLNKLFILSVISFCYFISISVHWWLTINHVIVPLCYSNVCDSTLLKVSTCSVALGYRSFLLLYQLKFPLFIFIEFSIKGMAQFLHYILWIRIVKGLRVLQDTKLPWHNWCSQFIATAHFSFVIWQFYLRTKIDAKILSYN